MSPLMHHLHDLGQRFSADPNWLDAHFALEGTSLPDHPDWQPYVHEDQYGALEAQTRCFVPFGALRRS